MGKGTIGVLAALAAWAGGAMSAQAQNIDVGDPSPTSLLEGSGGYDATINVYSAPSSFKHRLLVYRGTTVIANTGWKMGSGSSVMVSVASYERFEGEFLEHRWSFTATGWTGTTEIWNVEVLDYYGNRTRLNPSLRPEAEDALVWLDPKALGVQA